MLRTGVQGSSSVQRSRALTGNGMWAAIAAAVLYHEINCREGELLSEAVDRGLAKHPVPIYVLVLVTAAHLLNWLPSPNRSVSPDRCFVQEVERQT